MEEAENEDVYTEAVPPSAEDHVHHSDSQSQEVSDKEMNFKALREKTEKLQSQLDSVLREREEERKRLAYEEAQKKAPPPEEDDDLDSLDDDDWISAKQARRLAEKRAIQAAKEELDRREAERIKKELPNRLEKEFPDINQVVTPENVDYLMRHKPHLVETLRAQKDEYLQAVAAYDMIKTWCPSAQVAEEQEKAAANAKKPGTLGNAHSGTPLSQAKAFEKGLTKDLRKSLWEEMNAAAKKA